MSKKRIFAEEHPEYLKYWDFEKNTLDPYKIGPMCNEKAYWKCEHGHQFERIVFNVSRGNTTCPECKKRSTMVISKPGIMKFWDKKKTHLILKSLLQEVINMPGLNVLNVDIHGGLRYVDV